ncbi:DUF1648 domain-containing protein [Propionibacteriaceae bacterium G57]|uniref:DUF1648 domain-containing protein n=1 Tax=Aestuariimicrobium sp. G57 TaxID=3418485 RepID=UPI003DA7A6F5
MTDQHLWSDDEHPGEVRASSSYWGWLIATLALGVIGVWVLVVRVYPGVPDPMPVHWNGAGVADGFTPKSLGEFIAIAGLGPFFCLVVFGIIEVVAAVNRGARPGDGAALEGQRRRSEGLAVTRKHLGWYLFAMSALVLALVARGYSGTSSRWDLLVFLVAVFALTAVLVVVATRDLPGPAARR